MKILAVFASPRRDGNINKMLEAALEGARGLGHTVERIDLYQQKLQPCTGCMRCREKGVCVLKDALAPLREALLTCDTVVLAAPTYFANVPGPVKTLFDRLAGAVMEERAGGVPKGRLSPKQKYLLLTACTTPFPFDRLCGQSGGALRAMREFFKTAGMRPMGTFVFAGSKGRQVSERLLAKIRNVWT